MNVAFVVLLLGLSVCECISFHSTHGDLQPLNPPIEVNETMVMMIEEGGTKGFKGDVCAAVRCFLDQEKCRLGQSTNDTDVSLEDIGFLTNEEVLHSLHLHDNLSATCVYICFCSLLLYAS